MNRSFLVWTIGFSLNRCPKQMPSTITGGIVSNYFEKINRKVTSQEQRYTFRPGVSERQAGPLALPRYSPVRFTALKAIPIMTAMVLPTLSGYRTTF